MRLAIIRTICALACALAFHAMLVAAAVRFGWLAPDDATLPELDLTSVDLSFSETHDETASPVATPPPPPINEQPPPPPAPESLISDPPPLDERLHRDNGHLARCLERTGVSPVRDSIEPPPAETRPTDLRPPIPEPPETERKPEPPPQPQQPTAMPAPAPSQARVAADKPPVPRRRIKPEYPQGARQRGEEGDVTIEIDVSANGTVDGARIVASCGFQELEQAAIQAVKRARFTPARRGSAAVPATARLTLTFRLKD